jgi:hypothetical protein
LRGSHVGGRWADRAWKTSRTGRGACGLPRVLRCVRCQGRLASNRRFHQNHVHVLIRRVQAEGTGRVINHSCKWLVLSCKCVHRDVCASTLVAEIATGTHFAVPSEAFLGLSAKSQARLAVRQSPSCWQQYRPQCLNVPRNNWMRPPAVRKSKPRGEQLHCDN